jgi:hypothetical protein
MDHLLGFTKFISESEERATDSSDHEKTITILKTLDELFKIGLIEKNDPDLNAQIEKGLALFEKLPNGKVKNQVGNILSSLGSVKVAARMALRSPEAGLLRKEGLLMVSTPRQLENGNLIWSLDKNYDFRKGWAIGFFPGLRVVRRMQPKNRHGLNASIKTFPNLSPLEFFKVSMRWIVDNIDWRQAKANPEEIMPKYYTKRLSPKNYTRSESDALRIKARGLVDEYRIASHPNYPEFKRLMNLANELDLKNQQKQQDNATDRIL